MQGQHLLKSLDLLWWVALFGWLSSYVGLSSPMSWTSKRQDTTSKSFTESKYMMAFSSGSQDVVYLRRLLMELHFLTTPQTSLHCTNPRILAALRIGSSTQLLCDNQGEIKLAKNLVFHTFTKHIEIHHHFNPGVHAWGGDHIGVQ